jgi:hypothetical protein
MLNSPGANIMHINLSGHETEMLGRQAAAAGFASTDEYVAQFVHTLAQQPEHVLAPLDDEELAASMAMIDQGMADIRSGQGLDVEEARRQSLSHLGINGR